MHEAHGRQIPGRMLYENAYIPKACSITTELEALFMVGFPPLAEQIVDNAREISNLQHKQVGLRHQARHNLPFPRRSRSPARRTEHRSPRRRSPARRTEHSSPRRRSPAKRTEHSSPRRNSRSPIKCAKHSSPRPRNNNPVAPVQTSWLQPKLAHVASTQWRRISQSSHAGTAGDCSCTSCRSSTSGSSSKPTDAS